MGWAQVAFNAALLASVAIFVGLFAFLIREVRPFETFERGVAALLWGFPLSVLATMVLVYLDTPYIFLPLFGGPGLCALVFPPRRIRGVAGAGRYPPRALRLRHAGDDRRVGPRRAVGTDRPRPRPVQGRLHPPPLPRILGAHRDARGEPATPDAESAPSRPAPTARRVYCYFFSNNIPTSSNMEEDDLSGRRRPRPESGLPSHGPLQDPISLGIREGRVRFAARGSGATGGGG